jgi:hypothetical protein
VFVRIFSSANLLLARSERSSRQFAVTLQITGGRGNIETIGVGFV